MRAALLASFLISAALCLATPWLVARTLRQRWGVPWRVFGCGALVFLIFDLVTRQPLLALLRERLQTTGDGRLVGLVVSAVTAALLQEIGRCLGYRWWLRDRRGWGDAVAFGAGHGGAETFVLGGLGSFTAAVGYLVYALFGSEARVTAGMEPVLATARHTFATLPAGTPLLNAVESLASLPVQVALSLLVWRVFTSGGPGWLAVAVGCHAVWEFATGLAAERGGPAAGAGVAVAFAVLSVALIMRSRPAEAVVAAAGRGARARR